MPVCGRLRINLQPGSPFSVVTGQTSVVITDPDEPWIHVFVCIYTRIFRWHKYFIVEVPLWSCYFLYYDSGSFLHLWLRLKYYSVCLISLPSSKHTINVKKRTKHREKLCTKCTILIQLSVRYKHYDAPVSSRLPGLWECCLTVHHGQEFREQENSSQH
jgi:hypothetical protein